MLDGEAKTDIVMSSQLRNVEKAEIGSAHGNN